MPEHSSVFQGQKSVALWPSQRHACVKVSGVSTQPDLYFLVNEHGEAQELWVYEYGMFRWQR